jgi:hypothetical protein
MDDMVFELFASSVRREILASLADDPRQELSVSDDVANGDERSRVTLHHKHLPKLADEAVIRWDSEDGTVTRGPNFEACEPLLRFLDDADTESLVRAADR